MTRASAIIIQDNQILLIHRKREGKEYWITPGGTVEDDETPEQAVMREVKEETSLTATVIAQSFTFEADDRTQLHFICSVDSKNVMLGGPEALKNNPSNWYRPEWVPLDQIKYINMVPEEVKIQLLKLIT